MGLRMARRPVPSVKSSCPHTGSFLFMQSHWLLLPAASTAALMVEPWPLIPSSLSSCGGRCGQQPSAPNLHWADFCSSHNVVPQQLVRHSTGVFAHMLHLLNPPRLQWARWWKPSLKKGTRASNQVSRWWWRSLERTKAVVPCPKTASNRGLSRAGLSLMVWSCSCLL